MTHELKKIFDLFISFQNKRVRAVLATVVALDGTSYRRPGVRMLVLENGQMIGAVSGGCVEKEIQRQATDVFKTGFAKMMTYGGRFKLGCEGVLYILLESFNPSIELIKTFSTCLERRSYFNIVSYYEKEIGAKFGIGSFIKFSNKATFSLSGENNVHLNGEHKLLKLFNQTLPPCFQLIIIGEEHDAVQLCLLASITGWDVTVVTSPSNTKELINFPGAKQVLGLQYTELQTLNIDKNTAVLVMTHSFAKDLKYLIALKEASVAYLGLLGSAERKEKLMMQLLEYYPATDENYLENIHGPAGISIGSETPQEIAISIIAEILSVTRNQKPIKLSNKPNRIHA